MHSSLEFPSGDLVVYSDLYDELCRSSAANQCRSEVRILARAVVAFERHERMIVCKLVPGLAGHVFGQRRRRWEIFWFTASSRATGSVRFEGRIDHVNGDLLKFYIDRLEGEEAGPNRNEPSLSYAMGRLGGIIEALARS